MAGLDRVFGEAFAAKGYGGPGGLNAKQASNLDRELRTAAAFSPVANRMGAVMAMAQAGVLGRVGEQILKDPRARDQFLNQAGATNPSDFLAMMGQHGVKKDVAAQFLNARGANMSQVEQFGLADKVRRFQGAELAGIMSEKLSGGLMSSLKQQGYSARERRTLAPQLASMMQTEMAKLAEKDPSLFSDPAKAGERNRQLQAAMGKAGVKLDAGTVAASVRGLEESVRSDPMLQKFGNLAGMLGMNQNQVFMEADKQAEALRKMEATNVPGREYGKNTAAVANGGQAPIRIQGTLTIRADGTAQIDADSGPPINE